MNKKIIIESSNKWTLKFIVQILRYESSNKSSQTFAKSFENLRNSANRHNLKISI